ncbi:MAG TPA: alpha-hydroxy-acid oxidizing protein, partial [Ktedonobacteraceae bacterium]|nr:alpha-hydroxy-acid oxidizing protein [Ktedonobacteraceae bacterium]
MQPVNLNDYETLAQTRMERPIWDYYQGGSGDEITLRENRRVFDRLWLRPRVLVNVDSIDASTSILGTPVSMPILVAPTAAHGMLLPEGECATAQAVGEAGTIMSLSTDS